VYKQNGGGAANIEKRYIYGSDQIASLSGPNTYSGSSITALPERLYELRDHLGNTRVVFGHNTPSNNLASGIKAYFNYYAFGSGQVERTYSPLSSLFTYNNKRNVSGNLTGVNAASGLLDYGARWYRSDYGRWMSIDPLAGKYSFVSPYNYALNTPIQAKDPDGQVVIFINGMHAGDGGQAKYWGGYDSRAMNQLKDYSARYVDGALGGIANTKDHAIKGLMPVSDIGIYGGLGGMLGSAIRILTSSNVSYKIRIEAGKNQGFKDAESIVNNLTDGESIKLVTHSMGTAFARGYVQGIQKYLNKNNLASKVKIDFELDVNAFQGEKLPRSPLVQQTYNKTGGLDGGSVSAIAAGLISVPTVAPVPGAIDISTNADQNKGHAIGEMSTENIPSIGNAGTTTQKPIEQGVNNGN